jgi:hypothetical protein
MDDRMNDIIFARQLAAHTGPLLRRLADRLERAEAVLEKIAMAEGPMEGGEPCPVCGLQEHGSWCWYPDLQAWDKWQAQL